MKLQITDEGFWFHIGYFHYFNLISKEITTRGYIATWLMWHGSGLSGIKTLSLHDWELLLRSNSGTNEKKIENTTS